MMTVDFILLVIMFFVGFGLGVDLEHNRKDM